jgi:hypothetical protein
MGRPKMGRPKMGRPVTGRPMTVRLKARPTKRGALIQGFKFISPQRLVRFGLI